MYRLPGCKQRSKSCYFKPQEMLDAYHCYSAQPNCTFFGKGSMRQVQQVLVRLGLDEAQCEREESDPPLTVWCTALRLSSLPLQP